MKQKFQDVLGRTEILKMPRHSIATFGATDFSYTFLAETRPGTLVREGRIRSERPKIILPAHLEEHFEGFGQEAREFAKALWRQYGSDLRMLDYRFKHEPSNSRRLEEALALVAPRVLEQAAGESLAAVIRGPALAWEISMVKFIVDMTARSFRSNIQDLQQRGFFNTEGPSPEVRARIEILFHKASQDPRAIQALGSYLREQGLFDQYQDRFFSLFQGHPA